MSHIHKDFSWLGAIPTHWQVLNLRQILTACSEKNHPDMPLLSVVREKGVIVRNIDDKNHNYVPDDLSNYKLVKRGQFAVNKMKAWQGSYGVSQHDGIVSPAYFVFNINHDMNHDFFDKAIRSKIYVNYFGQASDGIRVGQWDLSMKRLRDIPFCLPPREEQEQIVRFLDWKVSAIDKLIATKEKQLSILKELLQAKIEKQLHAYPISNTLRLKQLGTFSKGGGFSRDNLVETETYPAILYGDIYTQYEYKTSVIPHHIDGIAYSASRKISKGDIVMAGTGETKDDIGKSILYMGNQSVAVGGDVIIFHPNAKNNAEYLLYQLYSQAALKHRYISSKGDIIVHIYPTAIGNILITLPCVHDQKKAVKRINANIHRVNKTLHLLNEQISNLRELKTRLISDAVTGKIDVRSIKLPNFAKEE
ncbi:restriction endonuclease subunit S [Selenomonas sputigena]|uniref:restriction endonuclease subunit S n=1 Tax=Selenomonas sputigena TaxID=69823 RepID=UPI00222F1B79|nr:restriction endonuclease subunit S [Selenomonas sputigena]UZD43880.1 restriction endonuclease subunit S [Selenomonas sputigena]